MTKRGMRFCVVALLVVSAASLSVPAVASDLVLLNGITASSVDGDVVQVRESTRDGCVFIGTFHSAAHTATGTVERAVVKALASGGVQLTDWSVELTRKRCGEIYGATQVTIPLSTGHTYMDSDGKFRPGYAPGDVIATQGPTRPAHN